MSDVAVDTADKKPAEPAQPAQPEPKTPKDESGDGFTGAFKALQSDKNRLEAELTAASKKYAELTKERDELRGKVDGFIRKEREGAVVSRLKTALPHVEDLALRGVLAALHEDAKIDKHSEDAEATAKAVLEHLKNHAPAMMRPPALGGGPGGAPQQERKAASWKSPVG